MNRVFAIVRMQAAGRRDGLVWPLVILSIAFAVNLVLYGSMGEEMGDRPVTGGLASIYITALAFGAMAMAQQFPFALGMSVTRREFGAAIGLFTLAQTVIYAVLLVVFQAVEDATGGWGLRLRFFAPGDLGTYGVPTQLLVYGVPMLLMSCIGIALGAVYVRWRTNGVFGAIAAVMLVLGLAAALVTRAGKWPAVGDWLLGQSALSLFAGWPSIAVVLLAALSWTALRKATA
ncbi:hypothetical protein [Dactylosporangium sp. NPDC000521]|uniref:hypothetical protein n=1 Tax=Dactylosporangium sp. NPDC000521 TaxID=3363975 RepID=UPI0036A9A60D